MTATRQLPRRQTLPHPCLPRPCLSISLERPSRLCPGPVEGVGGRLQLPGSHDSDEELEDVEGGASLATDAHLPGAASPPASSAPPSTRPLTVAAAGLAAMNGMQAPFLEGREMQVDMKRCRDEGEGVKRKLRQAPPRLRRGRVCVRAGEGKRERGRGSATDEDGDDGRSPSLGQLMEGGGSAGTTSLCATSEQRLCPFSK